MEEQFPIPEEIPPEILSMVGDYLPMRDYKHLRSTSKNLWQRISLEDIRLSLKKSFNVNYKNEVGLWSLIEYIQSLYPNIKPENIIEVLNQFSLVQGIFFFYNFLIIYNKLIDFSHKNYTIRTLSQTLPRYSTSNDDLAILIILRGEEYYKNFMSGMNILTDIVENKDAYIDVSCFRVSTLLSHREYKYHVLLENLIDITMDDRIERLTLSMYLYNIMNLMIKLFKYNILQTPNLSILYRYLQAADNNIDHEILDKLKEDINSMTDDDLVRYTGSHYNLPHQYYIDKMIDLYTDIDTTSVMRLSLIVRKTKTPFLSDLLEKITTNIERSRSHW